MSSVCSNLLNGTLEFNLKIERKLVSAEEALDFAGLWLVECGRRSERRRGLCVVLDEDGDEKIIHLCKQKINSFVEN